ncbi:hypothetical protein LX36DRAFT_414099 [Colletotrichum falcatum]|nr:hypothetical protein LX36DRAFT_414099 [Colletotrichum falcatum]
MDQLGEPCLRHHMPMSTEICDCIAISEPGILIRGPVIRMMCQGGIEERSSPPGAGEALGRGLCATPMFGSMWFRCSCVLRQGTAKPLGGLSSGPHQRPLPLTPGLSHRGQEAPACIPESTLAAVDDVLLVVDCRSRDGVSQHRKLAKRTWP